MSNREDAEFDATGLHHLYSRMGEAAGIHCTASSDARSLEISDCGKYIVVVNHGREPFEETLALAPSMPGLTDVSTGARVVPANGNVTVEIPPFNGMILEKQL